ncbi:Integrase, catalytic region, putative [Theobroma cacao]|uniref:Integrase, catalytic region, putative n=1 Tax=Theobroma cacao TaxID=3641 RepID=A0A061G4K7_THECC|nr:Integrase, catalytic region, putative [Theobroma cacao]
MSESTESSFQGSQTMSQTSPIGDPQFPYFLHHTNHPGSVIINPKLTTTNYVTWSRSFLLALSIRNKKGFINGTISKPQPTDPLYPSWIRCNNLIVAWLLDSITPPIASTIFYMDSVVDIWNTLKQSFAQPDDSRVCNLQYTLGNVTQGTRSVDSYFIELKGIWEELRNYRPLPHCVCGKYSPECFRRYSDQYQKDMVFRFLNGLNDFFSAVRSQIILMDPIPSLDKVYNLVLREEAQRNLLF